MIHTSDQMGAILLLIVIGLTVSYYVGYAKGFKGGRQFSKDKGDRNLTPWERSLINGHRYEELK